MSTTQPIRNKEQLKKFKEYYLYEKPNVRNYVLIVMGLNTALRISDILQLTYEDVYDGSKHCWRSYLFVKEQKTGKMNQIYMNKEIRTTLEQYMSSIQEEEWLFQSQKQKAQPLSRYQAYRIIREAAVHAGLERNISCHSLRKTFGYHAWKAGTAPALLMNIYNHSSYQITKRYLCIDQDDKDEVFKKVNL